jgi:ATP-binding cassette subfamily C (CFTR/MRP) protein 1
VSPRENLDPGGEHADSELWQVLQTSQLKQTIEGLPGQLQARVDEEGTNFSAGQRQVGIGLDIYFLNC